jgi:hypothetical protein
METTGGYIMGSIQQTPDQANTIWFPSGEKAGPDSVRVIHRPFTATC